MTAPTPHIVQIIPASSWRWKVIDTGECFPLSCLALVERDWGDGRPPERTVEGIDLACDGIHGLVQDLACSIEYLPPEETP